MSKSRRRGNAFEWRVAKLLGGTVYPGQAGDVIARGYRIECKFRTDLKLESSTTLRDWLDQIERYEINEPEEKFILVFSGGGKYQKNRMWVTMPMDEFLHLTDPVNNRQVLDALQAIERRYLT